jgi:hypothetical protein
MRLSPRENDLIEEAGSIDTPAGCEHFLWQVERLLRQIEELVEGRRNEKEHAQKHSCTVARQVMEILGVEQQAAFFLLMWFVPDQGEKGPVGPQPGCSEEQQIALPGVLLCGRKCAHEESPFEEGKKGDRSRFLDRSAQANGT